MVSCQKLISRGLDARVLSIVQILAFAPVLPIVGGCPGSSAASSVAPAGDARSVGLTPRVAQRAL